MTVGPNPTVGNTPMDINDQITQAEATLRAILDEHDALPDSARDQLAACRQQYGEQQAVYLQLLKTRDGL